MKKRGESEEFHLNQLFLLISGGFLEIHQFQCEIHQTQFKMIFGSKPYLRKLGFIYFHENSRKCAHFYWENARIFPFRKTFTRYDNFLVFFLRFLHMGNSFSSLVKRNKFTCIEVCIRDLQSVYFGF